MSFNVSKSNHTMRKKFGSTSTIDIHKLLWSEMGWKEERFC